MMKLLLHGVITFLVVLGVLSTWVFLIELMDGEKCYDSFISGHVIRICDEQ
jgi:hypothetical protein